MSKVFNPDDCSEDNRGYKNITLLSAKQANPTTNKSTACGRQYLIFLENSKLKKGA